MTDSIGLWWMWLGFIVFILLMLSLDIFVLGGGKSHKVSFKEAIGWSLGWFVLALVFNGLLWCYLHYTFDSVIATEKATEFFTGYLIEKSLSVDNLFIFLMIFQHFAVPDEYQQRVLLYGVLGAIVLRVLLILMGVWLVTHFHWILYLFGFFLFITGIKMLAAKERKGELRHNFLIQFLQRWLRVTPEFHQEKFIVYRDRKVFLTPLFLVLILIEVCDLIFAMDSIPAIFAITTDPFIVFTSNIFAILGLRALYFALAGMAERFTLLKYGLALVLIFIGIKLLIAGWIKVPVGIALGVVAAIIVTSVLLSLIKTSKRRSLSLK